MHAQAEVNHLTPIDLHMALLWKLNRLRTMGVREVGYRLGRAVRARLERLGVGGVRSVPAPSEDPSGKPWLATRPPFLDRGRALTEAADSILAGYFDVFALRRAPLGFPPDWNRDPRTGRQAPLTFGKTLNYRNEALVGDIKYLWEPNRHLELVTLAQAWLLTEERRYAEGARTLLTSWFAACPYPFGPNWTSSLEHAVRLLNWSAAWHLLGGDGSPLFAGTDGAVFRRRWLEAIYQHCHFIAGHLSHHSSANNHLLGEYMGLWFGTLTWPLWRASARWQKLAKQGLEQEALRQNGEDGFNREQAIWYHHEVADMLLLCGLAVQAQRDDFSEGYWRRVVAMLEVIASLMDVKGNLPMVGDSDDAMMVRLSREPQFCPYRSLLATGALLFDRGDLARKAGRLDDKTRWLLSGRRELASSDPGPLDARFEALIAEGGTLPVRRVFPDAGYCLLGGGFEGPREIRLLADAGSLGYLSIAAHGHADALALWLSVAGQELLVDPGTFAYHTQKKWRDYFRGTSAHNTVRVDGLDQSVSGGNFMWVRHAKARVLDWEFGSEQERWVGEHDGYQRLKDSVTHRREILLDKAACTLLVRDRIDCRAEHRVERFWHLAEDCVVTETDGEVAARKGGVILRIRSQGTAPLAVEVVMGREDPPLGWVSRRFDSKVSASTLVITDAIAGTTTLETEISWQFPA
ncbi:MAG: alginate lyase family protein [Gammaproteobacteria bacterium]